MKPLHRLAAGFLSLLPLHAEEVILTPLQDRDVYEFTGMPTDSDYSLGVSSSVAFGGGHSQKSVVQFDVTEASTAMTAADIGRAKLRLYVLPPGAYPFGQNIGGDILISFQTQPWTEDTLRWATFSAGGPINTLTLTADRPYDDGRGTTIYQLEVWVEVDVTSAVKAWLAGEQANHGFLLEPDEENSPYLSAAFADSITGWKPELVITRAEETETPKLELTSFSLEGNQVTLAWDSRPGARYAVRESPDLSTWKTLHEITADSISTTTSFTGSDFPEKRAFYLVEELPPKE